MIRALLILLVAASGCSDASAGGFPWARRPSGGGGGGGGTPAVLQAKCATLTASGTHNTLAFDSNLASGSWIVVGCTPRVTFETMSMSDTKGSTFTQQELYDSGTYGHIQVWTAQPTSGADTVDCQGSSGNNSVVCIAEVSNIGTGVDVHNSGCVACGFSSSVDFPSLTLNHTDFVWAMTAAGGLDNEAVTYQAGWSHAAVPSHQAWFQMWKEVNTAGALTPHVDLASGSYGSAADIALY